MHLRMASLTYMARFGLPIVAVSGLQDVRLLPLRALQPCTDEKPEQTLQKNQNPEMFCLFCLVS